MVFLKTGFKTELVSDERSGLYIEVRAGNIGTYYLRYKNSNGKTAHQKLGRTNEISLGRFIQKLSAISRFKNPLMILKPVNNSV